LIERHLARLREQIELQRKLCQRLEAIAAGLRTAGEVSAEEFLQTIEVMSMIEQYYTPEQMEYFRKQHEADQEGTAERARQGQADRRPQDRNGTGHQPPPIRKCRRWKSAGRPWSTLSAAATRPSRKT